MRRQVNTRIHTLFTASTVLPMLFVLCGIGDAVGQDIPPQRQIRTFIPANQIVSFLPATTFTEFVEGIDPIFVEVTGKRLVDPESRTFPINVSIVGMQFFDAFELVLEVHRLTYRETDQYFIIERAPEPSLFVEPEAPRGLAQEILATRDTREILIEAILFEVNLTRARQSGTNWSVFLGEQPTAGGGQPGDPTRPRFFMKTDELFDPFDDWLLAPDLIDFSKITTFFEALETSGTGKTIASPSVVVKSDEEGRIQIGTDIPVTVRDFAGNTITQFVSTGIIINVTPTLIRDTIADSADSPLFDFIHLDVRVEASAGRPFGQTSVAIDRSQADTKVLLLDDEVTVIGGLYSTSENKIRRGIPILKDLPWWFFGLRYLFGNTQSNIDQEELLIVLRARILDSLPERASRMEPNRDLLNKRRQEILETLERFDERTAEEFPFRPREETVETTFGTGGSVAEPNPPMNSSESESPPDATPDRGDGASPDLEMSPGDAVRDNAEPEVVQPDSVARQP